MNEEKPFFLGRAFCVGSFSGVFAWAHSAESAEDIEGERRLEEDENGERIEDHGDVEAVGDEAEDGRPEENAGVAHGGDRRHSGMDGHVLLFLDERVHDGHDIRHGEAQQEEEEHQHGERVGEAHRGEAARRRSRAGDDHHFRPETAHEAVSEEPSQQFRQRECREPQPGGSEGHAFILGEEHAAPVHDGPFREEADARHDRMTAPFGTAPLFWLPSAR